MLCIMSRIKILKIISDTKIEVVVSSIIDVYVKHCHFREIKTPQCILLLNVDIKLYLKRSVSFSCLAR